jgi:hypothetical protein
LLVTSRVTSDPLNPSTRHFHLEETILLYQHGNPAIYDRDGEIGSAVQRAVSDNIASFVANPIQRLRDYMPNIFPVHYLQGDMLRE